MIIKKGRKILADNVIMRKSVVGHLIGLRFFRKLKDNEAMLFVFKKPLKSTVDMFFVFYAIDIIFLDERKKIIDLKKNMPPFSFFIMKKKCRYMIEMRKGSIRKNMLSLNDTLSF